METPPAICVNTNQNGALGAGRVSVLSLKHTLKDIWLNHSHEHQSIAISKVLSLSLSKDINNRPVLSRNRGDEVTVFVTHKIVVIPFP